jgi:hypothetical protein
MKYLCWPDFGDQSGNRGLVPKIAFDDGDEAVQMFDEIGAAPPALDSVHLYIGEGEDMVGEVASGETGESGDEYALRHVFSMAGFK